MTFEWVDGFAQDPSTPLFDSLWAVMVMGRHDDPDSNADDSIPTPKRASHKVEPESRCGYPVDRTAPDWPTPFGAIDANGNARGV